MRRAIEDGVKKMGLRMGSWGDPVHLGVPTRVLTR